MKQYKVQITHKDQKSVYQYKANDAIHAMAQAFTIWNRHFESVLRDSVSEVEIKILKDDKSST